MIPRLRGKIRARLGTKSKGIAVGCAVVMEPEERLTVSGRTRKTRTESVARGKQSCGLREGEGQLRGRAQGKGLRRQALAKEQEAKDKSCRNRAKA